MLQTTQKQNENLQPRPPIVVVLGHVDHGKSSILEAIKDLKITEKEAGGITQHVGAYEVEHQGKKITFIDTPGHEAFSAIRSRGAKAADIAVLVVAADEGVKTQTKEAILHIKKAGIPFIVAINKIDKPNADPEKVKRELAQNDVLVESMGGKIPSVETSAITKKGIDELLELILLTAEIEEFKCDISKSGEGVVIEAYLDSKRGPTATLLLRDGILKLGDIIATASSLGKVKVLENFQGEAINQALPSMPIIVVGFENVPQIGEKFRVYPDISSAQKYITKKERKKNTGLTGVFLVEKGKRILNLILKADVSGSLEAIEGMLKELPQEKVIVRVLESKVGEINENDVKLAKSAKAKIIGFRQKVNPIAAKLAEREGIKIIIFDVIYELIQAIRQLMEKTIEPEKVREELGKMKVLLIFRTEKNRQIVGGKIIEGRVKKGLLIEVFRNEEKVGRGKIVNLQKNKKDIESAGKGEEVGILYQGDVKIEEGDVLVFYSEKREKEKL
ncbi:MAG: translation initiation factor IF-2 [Candidatus Omnitrophica bacterium 4484_213]|nr:MAG: translation initiation factor IF-2 [Candidatus Omnitrophica bacterium 4484_213]